MQSLQRRSEEHNRSLNLLLLLILIDSFLINIAEVISFEIRFQGLLPEYNFAAYQNMILLLTATRLSCLYIFRAYHHIKTKSAFQSFVEIIKANTLSSLLIIVAAFFFGNFSYPRIVIVYSWVITTISLFGLRILIRKVTAAFFKTDYFFSKMIIIGTNKEAQRLGLNLIQDSYEQIKIVGFIALNGDDVATQEVLLNNFRILGKLDHIEDIVRDINIDEIIVADRRITDRQLTFLLSRVNKYGIAVRIIPSLYEMLIGATVRHNVAIPLVKLTLEPLRGWYPGFKRLADVLLAIIGLLVCSPILLLAFFALKLENMPSSALFKQVRVGLDGKEFVLYKLRTMVDDAEEKTGPVWAEKNDPRVTRVGRLLRISRIDELPQLINILRGEMSLIGPRPERPFFIKELIEKIPCYAERFNVKPGITGWAQVNFKYASSIADNQEKLLYDLYYIQNMSPTLDFFIFLRTLGLIFGRIEVH